MIAGNSLNVVIIVRLMQVMKFFELCVIVKLTSENQINTKIIACKNYLKRHLTCKQGTYKVGKVPEEPVGEKTQ